MGIVYGRVRYYAQIVSALQQGTGAGCETLIFCTPSTGGMTMQLRYPDLDAHEPGCLEADLAEPCADPGIAYIDVFCDCHRYTEPKVLMNGTDIAWPAGWTERQAAEWREQNGLVPALDPLPLGT
jgi:hypothetical protein